MLTVTIANPERLALEMLAQIMQPPPPVDLERWAVDNISFGPGESSFPGPYNPDLFPFWSEVLAALSPEDPCRTVTLMKSAQLGGTIVANIFTLGSMDLDPGPLGYVHPSELNGATWSRQKLAPMIRQNSRLAALFPEQGREGGNSVLYKERADGRGFVKITGANSASGLSMQTWGRVCMDDLSKWEFNAGGDPEAQAESRAQSVELAKLFKISTPLLADSCRITRSFLSGSQERYHVPCPHCDHLQVLEWDNMLAATGDDGPAENASFSCVACGGVIEERHRRWMIDPANGACWIAKHPERKARHRSFHIWSAYAGLMEWSRIFQNWLDRRGSPASEQVFLNDVVGLAYAGDSEGPNIEDLHARAERGHARGTLPPGMPLLFAGVDVQEDRVEWALWAFGENGRRGLVDAGVIPHAITEKAAHDRLDGLLKSTWPTANGRRIAIDGLAIDGGYDTTNVFQWVRRHPLRRVMMVRGVPGPKPSVLKKVGQTSNRSGKPMKYGGRFFNVAVDELKLGLYRALKIEDPDAPFYVALFEGCPETLIDQITAERREQRRRKRDGLVEIVWALPAGRRNEQLDMANYAEAAALRAEVVSLQAADWQRLRMERESEPEAPQLDFEAPVVSQPTTQPRRRKGRRVISKGIH